MEQLSNDSKALKDFRPLSNAKMRARPRTSINNFKKRPGSSFQPFAARPQTSYKQISNLNMFKPRKVDESLDVLQLILKNAPVKYNLDAVGKKVKKLNAIYNERRKDTFYFTQTDKLYYRYNILYGSNTNNFIRTYSPKMRPQSASVANFCKGILSSDSDCKVFKDDEIQILFDGKCKDLNINKRPNLEKKFHDYCDKMCINRHVDFTECNMSYFSAEAIAKVMASNTRIANLKLARNMIGDLGTEVLMKAIQNSTDIVHLDLSSNDITHKGGEIIFSTLLDQHSIISLNISSVEGINRNRLTSEGVKLLEQVLKVNYFLEFLNLSGNSITNKGLKHILQGLNNNSTLHVLDLSHNEIDHSGMKYFTSKLKLSKLTDLNLSQNKIRNEGAIIIGDCMSCQSLALLKRLNLSECDISFNGFFELFLNQQNNKRWELLNMSKNNLCSENFNQLKMIFLNTGLKELKLSQCKIGNSGAQTIAACLCINNSIRKLDISNNKITDMGFKDFVSLPQKNSYLEFIDVSKNLITDATAKEFISSLKLNTSLKGINFFDNQLQNESGSAMIDALRTNKQLVNINLHYNRIQMRIIDEIKRLLKNNYENSRQKFIPNLKREIKNLFVTPSEFEQTEQKIQENEAIKKNQAERVKDETVKYAILKKEEEEKVKDMELLSTEAAHNLREMEEMIRKTTNETKLIQNAFTIQSENYSKEIAALSDQIKALEVTQKDLKNEEQNVQMQFEFQIHKLLNEMQHSDEKLTLAKLSAETTRRDIENKKRILEKLEMHEKLAGEYSPKRGQRQMSIKMNDSGSGNEEAKYSPGFMTKKSNLGQGIRPSVLAEEMKTKSKSPKAKTKKKVRAKSSNPGKRIKNAEGKETIKPVISENVKTEGKIISKK